MDAAEMRKCTFTLQVDAAVETGVFVAPGFRFRFLDGTKKQTQAISASSEWTPVQENADFESPSAPVLRFQQTFSDVEISEAFAVALDDDPVLSFFLFDHPGLAGDGTPRASGKDAKPAAAKAPVAVVPAALPTQQHPPKAFAGLFEMDVSSLLAGKLHVEQTWTVPSSLDNSSSKTDLETGSGGVFAPKPSRERPPSGKSLWQLPSASGLKYLAIRVSVDRPLLVGSLLKKLNPLTITVGTARRLPGVATRRSGTASPHAPLIKYCKPAFALIHFFPDQLQPRPSSATTTSLSPPHTLPRILLTPALQQTVHWNASVTLLCGRFEPCELLDVLHYSTMTVEIHDRDLKQEETLARLQTKWESLYTTGVDPSLEQHDSTAVSASSHENLPPASVKPLELAIVDDIARRDGRTLLAHSRRLFPYGLVSFRLTELLNTAKQRMGATRAAGDSPYMALKLTADVIAMKRSASPLGTTAASSEEAELPSTLDLTALEKAIREPGAYVSTGTSVSIQVALQAPIAVLSVNSGGASVTPLGCGSPASTVPGGPEPPPQLKFSRLVVIIPYKDSATLGEVTHAMTAINLKALPGVPIRSYQLSESEKLDCDNGVMDVITGTQIIDSQFRMVILEGLAGKGMKAMHEQLQRKSPNDPQGYRVFANGTLLFARRLYTAFEIDLKRIKLRYPLPALMTIPDIYMRAKVSENCHQALAKLADLRQVQRLAEVKRLDLFPTAQMLLEVESKYGESITLEDIHGTSGSSSSGKTTGTSNSVLESNPSTSSVGNAKRGRKHPARTFKAPTDSTNASFEQSRSNRSDKNFLLERKKEADQVLTEYIEKKQLAAMLDDQTTAPIYMYSGQKLRDALQEELRKRLANDSHDTYTYSREFQSLALSMIKPETLQQTEEQEQRKKWTTERGFVYPAPRQPAEYYKHVNAPSAARCEDLHQPFVDNVNHPKPVSREAGGSSGTRGLKFSTLPSKDMIFGGTNGDGTVNPDYFRSVHLCGEGLRLEMEEALKKEQDEWERRLVVDKKQLKFLAHGNICSLPREKPSQLDKIADILRGPVASKSLRIVKNATLPSGKRVLLEKPPVTIHNQEEYVGCVAATFATSLRPTDSHQFVASSATTGKAQDFLFPSTTNILTPQVQKFTTRKEIIPVREAEKRGLIWRNE
ncbi:hypothetical protein BBJ28_00010045 [Nothophytophthora sp. Chile5]|nr:hypothetical protein BBJ28_00010045 [Nothophytophthora sp. Chile5]